MAIPLALATVAATCLIGASPAAAEEAGLCKVHEEECALENLASSVHLASSTSWTLLNSTANVLCLSALIQFNSLDETSTLDATAFSLTQCGTTEAHNNCTLTAEELPTFTLSKTALNLGELLTKGGKTRVKCTVFGFPIIDCTYSDSGLKFAVEGALHKEGSGHGKFVVSKAVVEKTKGGEMCPKEATVDGSLEPLEHLFVVQPQPKTAVLCKENTDAVCPADMKYVEFFKAIAPDPVLTSGVGFLLCEVGTIKGEPGNLGEPLLFEIFAIEFITCKHHAGGSCTVEAGSGHALLLRTALNLGRFKIDAMTVKIVCQSPAVTCEYGGSPVLHFKGSTSGNLAPLTASSLILSKTAGGNDCPNTVEWSGAYEVEIPDEIFIGR